MVLHKNINNRQIGISKNSVLIFVIFAVGWTMLLFQYVARSYLDIENSRESFRFRQKQSSYSEEAKTKLSAIAQDYNNHLEGGNCPIIDPFTAEVLDSVNSLNHGVFDIDSVQSTEHQKLEIEDLARDFSFNSNRVFGVLHIPKLKLEQAIYLGATLDNLAKGAAVIEGTSLPIGGKDSHCVLAGHNMQTHGVMFSDIDQLEKNDDIYIDSPVGFLHYVVSDILRIKPTDTDYLESSKDEDKISLLTCYRFDGIKDRYVVVAHRKTTETSSFKNKNEVNERYNKIVPEADFVSNLIGFSSSVLVKVLFRISVYILGLLVFLLLLSKKAKGRK